MHHAGSVGRRDILATATADGKELACPGGVVAGCECGASTLHVTPVTTCRAVCVGLPRHVTVATVAKKGISGGRRTTATPARQREALVQTSCCRSQNVPLDSFFLSLKKKNPQRSWPPFESQPAATLYRQAAADAILPLAFQHLGI